MAEASEKSVVASVPFSLLESVWMATEEGNQELLMFEAVSTDPALGGKYLRSRDASSVISPSPRVGRCTVSGNH